MPFSIGIIPSKIST